MKPKDNRLIAMVDKVFGIRLPDTIRLVHNDSAGVNGNPNNPNKQMTPKAVTNFVENECKKIKPPQTIMTRLNAITPSMCPLRKEIITRLEKASIQ